MEKNNGNKNRFFKVSRRVIIYCAASFVVGAAAASVAWYAHNHGVIQKLSDETKPLRQQNNPYNYINPLLGYELPSEVKEFNQYNPLKQDIQNAVGQHKEASLDSYAVYFRDLSLGRWVGINENTGYAPASMMKVAIMIAYFKEAESSPGILDKPLKYSTSTADEINGVPFETPSELQIDKTYTVEQLIEAMIISSDNGAKNALLDNINQNDLNNIYTDLGLPNPDNSTDYAISAKQYSLLLRVLYNATYLSRDYSEKALKIMSQAEYNQGLVTGLPKGIKASQKFGENVNDPGNSAPTVISLSNCGIIYHPTHPYILCVMTKGTNLQTLQNTIIQISKIAWQEVSSYAEQQSY